MNLEQALQQQQDIESEKKREWIKRRATNDKAISVVKVGDKLTHLNGAETEVLGTSMDIETRNGKVKGVIVFNGNQSFTQSNDSFVDYITHINGVKLEDL